MLIAGIDNGFGGDKFAKRDREKNNDIVFGKVISAIAEAPIDTEDMPLFEGKRYYLGEIALMENSEDIKNILDYKDHETYSPLFIWNSLKEQGIEASEDISMLAVGLSLAQKQYARQYVSRVKKFTVNGKKFDFNDKIILVPQGIGAKYAIDYFFYKDNAKPTYAIIDIGQLSVDTATVIQGVVREENAKGTAHDGTIRIIKELQELIAADERFSGELISIKEAQEVLYNGFFSYYGEDHDLSENIKELSKSYTSYLTSVLFQHPKTKIIFKKYKEIYFVGGGSYYLDKEILVKEAKVNEKSIIIPDNAEYLNAIGNLILAEKRMEDKQKKEKIEASK